MKHTAIVVTLGASVTILASGCEPLGSCSLTCYGDSGNIYYHGPYENYSKGECDDQAERSSSGVAPCVGDWEAY